jgi:hypothetical protein
MTIVPGDRVLATAAFVDLCAGVSVAGSVRVTLRRAGCRRGGGLLRATQ